MSKLFVVLLTSLRFLHNYFDGLTELFSNLYLTKFLGASAKSFFPWRYSRCFAHFAQTASSL